jgi:hypothetical protein
MAYIQAADLPDLVAGTLQELGRNKIQNIAQNLQGYELVPRWFKKGKLTVDDGYGIKRNLYNNVSGNARHVGLFDTDTNNIPNLIDQLEVPWRHAEAFWSVEYRSDVLMNRGASKIVDLIKLRRADAMLSMIEEVEDRGWGDAPSTTDKVLPYSIPYWVVKNNTVGFNGGYPGSHTTVGGVSLTDSPNFYNYSGQYTTINKTDLVAKMRTMHRKCRFKSPKEVSLPDYRDARVDQYRIYTNEDVISGFEDIGEGQNENLGKDIASMEGGGMAFRGHPLVWVPKLDSDTDDPVYFLDHSTFYACVLKGNVFRESRKPAPEQRNIEQYFIDISYNFVNVDRRRNGVLALDV